MKMLNNLLVNLNQKISADTYTTHSLNNGFQYENIYNLIAESEGTYNFIYIYIKTAPKLKKW